MGPGSADDITVSTQYDAVDNVTARTDALGNVSKSAYNALGVIVQSITPDNNSTFFEYDTGGLRIRSWTGDLGSIQAVQATGVAASIGDDLRDLVQRRRDRLALVCRLRHRATRPSGRLCESDG